MENVVRVRSNGAEQLLYAELECSVDLGPEQKGARMSREWLEDVSRPGKA